ncbi:MAG TPA: restriction endonuclease subunit S [Candidatus Acidoferrales bacterium]|nr:restriction endonuclease subunit S [Candidatus Acidoferrales bacterium]
MSENSRRIPLKWAVAPVHELFDVVGGGTPSTDVAEYWHGPIPWITSADIDERHQITPRRSISEQAIKNSATNRVPAGSVIVVTRVGLGKVGIAETPICFSQDSQALIFNKDILLPKYVLLYMGTAVQVFKHISRGTTISGVTKKQLHDLEFRLPPPPEQKRIVDEIEKQFTRLDAAVAALKRVQANLKRYRAAVLKAACEGRLVPTEAELARSENRSYEPASVLLERILTERRRRWENDQLLRFREARKEPATNWKAKYKEPAGPHTTSLPTLPEGWTWATFSQVIWQLRSGTSETAVRDVTDYPVLRSSAVRPGSVDFRDVSYLREEQSGRVQNYVQKGDVLVTRLSGSLEYVGVCALVVTQLTRAIQYPDRLFCAKLLDGVDGHFLSYCFRHQTFRSPMERAAKSTAGHQRISMSDLNLFTFALPPAEEQAAIVDAVEGRLSTIDHLQADLDVKLKSAQSLRQAILRRAFEGKLVPQDPCDKSASTLLDRIRAERQVENRGSKKGAKEIVNR